MFEGFTKNSVKFLAGLEVNNNREWFLAHKSQYKEDIEKPAKEFLVDMSHHLEEEFSSNFKAKIFRIYRDVRFSKDKTPYNPHVRMSFIDTNALANGRSFYLSLEAKTLIVGAGCLGFEAAVLEKYRRAVVDEEAGAELAEIIENSAKASLRIEEPELKRVPLGYDKDHPRERLLRRKGLTLWRDGKADELLGAGSIEYCQTQFEEMRPLYDWLGNMKD